MDKESSERPLPAEPKLEGLPLTLADDKEIDKARLAGKIARRPTRVELKLKNILKTESSDVLVPENLIASEDQLKSPERTTFGFSDRQVQLKSILKTRPERTDLELKGILPAMARSSSTLNFEPTALENTGTLSHSASTQSLSMRRSTSFHDSVEVSQTFRHSEYNRKPDADATFKRLTPRLKMEIREELNTYKRTEMSIHASSVKNTAFH